MAEMKRTFEAGEQVEHERFRMGRVELDKGLTVLVRFEHGIEECEKIALRWIPTPRQAIDQAEWHAPLEVITRIQADTIQSVNDTWGVFSQSRIALLPHQLWVCRQVLEDWPTRWLVADDVGLGKTIEAGLILSPLLARGTVKRVLIVCPASLVEQWQYRLRVMFDIRLARYSTDADTPKADFWNTHNQVVASLETLRSDHADRHARLMESAPWDLLLVDEAHHLNADERSGPTLGYSLVSRLVSEGRVRSIVFFTGTPHRGKNYGFISLLRLLRQDLFNPDHSLRDQLPRLREAMIRNNKQSVTDLAGRKLFREPRVTAETYQYSEAEARFYAQLTDFILTGKAYASSLSVDDNRTVMLVLIAMQKLASSSVAAIRRALEGRLARLTKGKQALNETNARQLAKQYEDLERSEDGDGLSRLEEDMVDAFSTQLRLMVDEESWLRQLVALAEEVTEETKVAKLISIARVRFPDRQILFFTEYKATQSLLMSALMQEFGDDSVTFINGDDRADGVVDHAGRSRTLYEKREAAAERFNTGKVRFLVSTEAGGEGIDLQERCHTLIHVDLPWNPMRLHQRVGRLNRYGQTQTVEVVSLRNPSTIEAMIWDKLNEKLNNIKQAFDEVMGEPEDLLQLVLGMTSPSVFREVFGEAHRVPRESLSTWFDQKTAHLGGKDAIEVARQLAGNSVRFDFQEVGAQIPKIDLPALRPFFVSMLMLNGRRMKEDDGRLTFKTPELWLTEPGVRPSYDELILDRSYHSADAAQRILGIGHKVLDQALQQAKRNIACVATLPADILPAPLFVFRIHDRVTGVGGTVRALVAGIELDLTGERPCTLLKDWELLEKLNGFNLGQSLRRAKTSLRADNHDLVLSAMEQAKQMLEERVEELNPPFRIPATEAIAVLWPMPASEDSTRS